MDETIRESRSRGFPFRVSPRIWILIALLAAGVVLLIHFLGNAVGYQSLEVMGTVRIEQSGVGKYCNVDGRVLHYSPDGAEMFGRSREKLWEISYDLAAPEAAVFGGTAAIYDAGGSDIIVCDAGGMTGEITTDLPVTRAAVSGRGTVAVLQDDGTNVWIRYYSKEGQELSAIKTSVSDPGYPMDFSVSEDGMMLAVSYLTAEDSGIKSTVSFYQFGTFGQNQMDNRVGKYEMKDTLVPQITYLNDDTAVAFRDNGFVIYKGGSVPEKKAEVTVQEEIASVLCDSRHIGMILRAEQGDHPFILCVYNTSGKELFRKGISFMYNSAEFSGDQVSLYNGSELCVYGTNGRKKYEGGYEGTAGAFFSLGTGQYAAADAEGISWLRLG